ncbi:uncharacterized protein LOC134969499 isoform X2 [Pseudophryne corroboree]|uniref:uncharacterized protein LOC134969499 isoform X2 n=1 Tax=Pseudophryne corroboree TaxID=495146 RepID=UPI003081E224
MKLLLWMEMMNEVQSSRDIGLSLPVVAKAIWQVLKSRDVQNFGRVLDFLDLTHEQAPGLLCYRHYAKLSAGLRGKSRRELSRARQVKSHFRKLVLRMIRDEKFRQNYVATTMNTDYGEQFMDVLEKLLWEFLCRLQTALNHQVTESTEVPVLEGAHLSSRPILPDSGLLNISTIFAGIYTEERSTMERNRDHPLLSMETCSSEEEEQDECEMQQYAMEGKQDSGRCEGSGGHDQIVLPCESSEESSFTRRTEDPVCSHNSGASADCNLGIHEHQSPYFDIFGFDCSESSKVTPFRKRSPPDPLQTPETDHRLGQELDSYSLHDWLAERSKLSPGKMQSEETSEEVSSECPIKISVLEQRDPMSHNSEINVDQSAEGEPSHLGLMSWRYQPKVYMTPLPLNLIRKYVCQQLTKGESLEGDLNTQAADSELSQYTTYADLGSWPWDSSVSTDNDSSDPDYSPGHNTFFLDSQTESIMRTKRVLRSSSLP